MVAASLDRTDARICRLRAGVIAVVLACLASLVISACGGGGSSPIAGAARRTARTPGFRFSLALQATGAGAPVAAQGSGVLEQPAGRGYLDLISGGRQVREVLAPPALYLRMPDLAQGIHPTQTPWLRVGLAAMTGSAGRPAVLAGGNPIQVLHLLEKSSDGSEVGRASVDGVAATQYRGTAPLEGAAGSVPVEVWVDQSGRVLRAHLRITACSAGRPLSESITVAYGGFGHQARVRLPSADQVTDVTGDFADQAGLQSLRFGRC